MIRLILSYSRDIIFPRYLAASPVIVPIGVNPVVVYPVVVLCVLFCPVFVHLLCYRAIEISAHNIEVTPISNFMF